MKVVEYRGARDLVCALVTEDSRETLSYGESFPIAGLNKVSKTVEASSETKHYDNIPAIVINSEGADTIVLDVSAIPYDVTAKITGQYYDENTGMLVEGAGGEKPYCAIGYITEDTDGNEVYVWRNKGTFALPGEDHPTKDNSTTANGQQLTFTGINTTHKFAALAGQKRQTCKGVILETVKELTTLTESTFFADVQDPDKIVAAKKTQNTTDNTENDPE